MFLKSLATTLALTLVLSGCGAAAPSTSSAASESAASSTPEAVAPAAPATSLGLTMAELTTALDTHNKEGNRPLLSEAPKAEATVAVLNEAPYLCTRYTLTNGLTVYFFTDTDKKTVRQFSWVCDERKLAEADIPLKEAMLAALPALFEPTAAEDLTAALALTNAEASVNTQSTMGSRDYYYRKYGGVLNFSVLPTGSSQLSWIGNTFTDVK